MQHIQGRYTEAALPELGEGEDIDTSLPADPDVKKCILWAFHCPSWKVEFPNFVRGCYSLSL